MKNILILLLVVASTSVVGQQSEYDKTIGFKNGVKYVVKGQCIGLINKQGEILPPIEYDDINRYKKGYVFIFKDGRRGVFSLKESKIIIPPKYGDIDLIKTEDVLVFRAYKSRTKVIEYSLNGQMQRGYEKSPCCYN